VKHVQCCQTDRALACRVFEYVRLLDSVNRSVPRWGRCRVLLEGVFHLACHLARTVDQGCPNMRYPAVKPGSHLQCSCGFLPRFGQESSWSVELQNQLGGLITRLVGSIPTRSRHCLCHYFAIIPATFLLGLASRAPVSFSTAATFRLELSNVICVQDGASLHARQFHGIGVWDAPLHHARDGEAP
jgi:hypothetical protein